MKRKLWSEKVQKDKLNKEALYRKYLHVLGMYTKTDN